MFQSYKVNFKRLQLFQVVDYFALQSHTEAALKKPSSKNRVFLRFDEKKQRYEARPVGKGIVRTWPSRIATFLVTAANVALAAGLSLEQACLILPS